jgi:L-lactate permease
MLYNSTMTPKWKRLAALLGAILLAGLAVTALLVAIFLPDQPDLLAGCVGLMIGLPFFLWIGIYIFGKIKKEEGFGAAPPSD